LNAASPWTRPRRGLPNVLYPDASTALAQRAASITVSIGGKDTWTRSTIAKPDAPTVYRVSGSPLSRRSATPRFEPQKQVLFPGSVSGRVSPEAPASPVVLASVHVSARQRHRMHPPAAPYATPVRSSDKIVSDDPGEVSPEKPACTLVMQRSHHLLGKRRNLHRGHGCKACNFSAIR
jgi:hypothetical protein